ncbi:MAG: STAS domain-containing protein [Paracoccaceae bacterium]
MLTHETIGSRTVVTVMRHRLDAAVAQDFKEQMIALIDAGHRDLLLDLGRIDFLDSSGLGALVGVLKYLGNSGRLELAGLTSGVEKVFRLTRLTAVFTIHDRVPSS